MAGPVPGDTVHVDGQMMVGQASAQPSACDVDAIAKPQTVRLPMKSPLARAFWAVAGIGTIYYNARNYLAVQQAIRAGEVSTQSAWRLRP